MVIIYRRERTCLKLLSRQSFSSSIPIFPSVLYVSLFIIFFRSGLPKELNLLFLWIVLQCWWVLAIIVVALVILLLVFIL